MPTSYDPQRFQPEDDGQFFHTMFGGPGGGTPGSQPGSQTGGSGAGLPGFDQLQTTPGSFYGMPNTGSTRMPGQTVGVRVGGSGVEMQPGGDINWTGGSPYFDETTGTYRPGAPQRPTPGGASPAGATWRQVANLQREMASLRSLGDPVASAQRRDALERQITSLLTQQGHQVQWKDGQLVVDGRPYELGGGGADVHTMSGGGGMVGFEPWLMDDDPTNDQGPGVPRPEAPPVSPQTNLARLWDQYQTGAGTWQQLGIRSLGMDEDNMDLSGWTDPYGRPFYLEDGSKNPEWMDNVSYDDPNFIDPSIQWAIDQGIVRQEDARAAMDVLNRTGRFLYVPGQVWDPNTMIDEADKEDPYWRKDMSDYGDINRGRNPSDYILRGDPRLSQYGYSPNDPPQYYRAPQQRPIYSGPSQPWTPTTRTPRSLPTELQRPGVAQLGEPSEVPEPFIGEPEPTPGDDWMPSGTSGYTPGQIGMDDIPNFSFEQLMQMSENPEAEGLMNSILANPESLDARTIETMKARSKDELAEMELENQDYLDTLGSSYGIQESPWLAAQKMDSRRARDRALIESNRNIELEAARTNTQDRRAAAELGLAFGDARQRRVMASASASISRAALVGDRIALRESVNQQAAALGIQAESLMAQHVAFKMQEATRRWGMQLDAVMERFGIETASRDRRDIADLDARTRRDIADMESRDRRDIANLDAETRRYTAELDSETRLRMLTEQLAQQDRHFLEELTFRMEELEALERERQRADNRFRAEHELNVRKQGFAEDLADREYYGGLFE